MPLSRKRRHLPILVRGLVGVAVIGVALGFFALLFVTKQEPERSEVSVRPLSVRAVELTAQPIARSYPGHGAVRAMRAVDIPSQLAARVAARSEGIEDGARVEAGDVILRLETRDFENRLEAARQRLASIDAQIELLEVEQRRLGERLELAEDEVRLARDEFDRATDAVRGGGASQLDIDRAEAALTRARREAVAIGQQLESIGPRRAQLAAERLAEERNEAIARDDLERATITSPIGGILQSVDAEVDEWVNAGERVARVVALDRLEVPLQIPLGAASVVRVGDEAELQADSPSAARWNGRIARISPEASAQTRSMIVFVEIDQALDPESGYIEPRDGAILLPGQYVVGRVRSAMREARIVVPRRAIIDDRVYVVESVETDAGAVSIVRPRPVVVAEHIEGSFPEIDPKETQWAVLERGVREGERVVVSNLDELSDSLAVEATTPEPGPQMRAPGP